MPDTAYHACLGDIDDISLDLLIETCERNYPQRDGIYEKAFAKIVERTEEMQDGREVDDNTLTSSYKMTYLGFINAEGLENATALGAASAMKALISSKGRPKIRRWR